MQYGRMFGSVLQVVVTWLTTCGLINAIDEGHAEGILAVQPSIANGHLRVYPTDYNGTVQYHTLTLIGSDSLVMVNDMMMSDERTNMTYTAPVSTSSSTIRHSSLHSSIIKSGDHGVIRDSVENDFISFPKFAVLYVNRSIPNEENETAPSHFTIFALNVKQVLNSYAIGDNRTSDVAVVYLVEIIDVINPSSSSTRRTGEVGNKGIPSEVQFDVASLFIDLSDEDKPTHISEYSYTPLSLRHIYRTGELAYNTRNFGRFGSPGEVSAQGVLTLWMLGPFSIPLYPAFIACCTASLIFCPICIQPNLFCCVI